MDFEPPDSEDERLATARDAGLAAEEPDSAQAPPPRLPGAWTFLSSRDQAALFQHWSTTLSGLDAGITAQRSAPDLADAAEAERASAAADDRPNVVAAERDLAAAEAFGAD